ncbi:MAG TPA: error-prone DNA polymerase [Acidimicrobiales bacterium]|nr:error-prone DNA polymerase [Acidimicrobiales bacterium]
MATTEPAYAELHCHSNFSFLDGASHPEALVAEAVRLGLSALALTDHHGLYGVVRFHEAATEAGLPTVFGAELALAPAGPRTGEADPSGHHLVVLARDPDGYARLSRVLADAHLAGGEKGRPVVRLEDLATAHGGHWQVLTGCRKGAVPATLVDDGPRAARRQLDRLVAAFGRDRVAVELWDHGTPMDSTRNDALARLAVDAGVDLVATNNVHYATPADFPLATTLAAVRANRPLDQLAGWLPASAAAALRSPAEQARRFARWPGVVARAAEIGADCAFDLDLVAPRLPRFFGVPPGETEQEHLEALVEKVAPERYGRRGAETVPGAWGRLDEELDVIGQLGFAGYFLTVWDIAKFCRDHDIFCQGRGSAATSAVCYVLGITVVDAVDRGLLFSRFLHPTREGAPDIDLDSESGRREEVIQYVYDRYGRRHTAQVANVITYRHRSAVRDVGKALGHDLDQLDRWARATDRGQPLQQRQDLPPLVRRLAGQVLHFPRHLGIHSGGMVICDRPVVDVCPVEPARMSGRTVLQWDKDDCATIKLVKFDLLGLGMLEALHHMVDLVAELHDVHLDLAALPDEPAVYELLGRADTVGVFQVESRAQMGTLPRVRPENLHELAIEVALIRPGPIQGDAVHPYIRRKQGKEPVVYLHPSLERLMKPALERILKRTLGVPLFQEQLMEITVEVADLSAVEADELRRAISHKRSDQLMARLKARLFAGMEAKRVPPEVRQDIYDRLSAFTSFGFPESHALSFAALVYCSAWLKLHYPAAFTAGLLNAQPMGFWSPQSLLADAKRHGTVVHRPDVNGSRAGARPAAVDPDNDLALHRATRQGGHTRPGSRPGSRDGGFRDGGSQGSRSRLDPAVPAVRLGLAGIRYVGRDTAERLVAGQPWADQQDLVRRGGLTRRQLEALALAGALDGFPGGRRPAGRRALAWTAGAAAQATPGHLPGIVTGATAPPLPAPTPLEAVADDLWAIGVTPQRTAIELVRPTLARRGVVPAGTLPGGTTTGRVTVAGVVTHRQQPGTAAGAVFLNLEDETGMVNVVCSRGAWVRWRSVARTSPALVVWGRLERSDGVVNVVAERFEPLAMGPAPASRDFR